MNERDERYQKELARFLTDKIREIQLHPLDELGSPASDLVVETLDWLATVAFIDPDPHVSRVLYTEGERRLAELPIFVVKNVLAIHLNWWALDFEWQDRVHHTTYNSFARAAAWRIIRQAMANIVEEWERKSREF